MTGPIAEPLRLHLNESPFPPGPAVIEAVARASAGLNRYPVSETALREALGAYAGVDPARIVISAGSNELLHMLPLLAGATAPGEEVVFASPSFPTYAKVAGFFRLAVRAVGLTPDGGTDVDAMLAALGPASRLVCVPSPNNPTGGMLDTGALERLADGVPKGVLLHLDEAYYEFGRVAGGPETLPILAGAKADWIATRSFSKAFGLAGARLGYGIASSAELASHWRELRPNFNVGVLSLAAGLAALGDLAGARAAIERIATEREWLAAELAEMGIRALPSAGNFLSFAAGRADLAERLAAAGVLVGKFEFGGRIFLRVTIGVRSDSETFLRVLKEIS